MKEMSFKVVPADMIQLPRKPLPHHWVAKEYGFEVFKSADPADKWIYIDDGFNIYAATIEFLSSTGKAMKILSDIKKIR